MLDEVKITKSTLKIFYFAYILTSLGGLLYMPDVSNVVFFIQTFTLLSTVVFFVLLNVLDSHVIVQHTSMFFYIFIVLTGMWHGLGSGSILYLVFSITLVQVIILTFRGRIRLFYLFGYSVLTLFFLLYDYLYRADSIEIQLFDQGKLIGVTIIISSLIFIVIINRIFVEDLLKQLKDYSYFDVLTGSKNSRAFYEEIKKYDSDYDRYGINYVLAYIDIDNYKEMNDIHGHLVGDKILEEFSRIVKQSIRHSDELYRIGGDEFVIILKNITLELATQKVDALHYKIISTDIMEQRVEFSYGIASKDTSEADVEVLLNVADKQMYHKKQEKKIG